MPLPPAVARFNLRYTNRFIEPLARRRAGFALVHHHGRVTGTAYRTPVQLFPFDGGANAGLVALTYGRRADWLQNVEAGGGSVEQDGVVRPISAVGVVGRADAWPRLPRYVRGGLRILRVDDFALIETVDPDDRANEPLDGRS